MNIETAAGGGIKVGAGDDFAVGDDQKDVWLKQGQMGQIGGI